MAIRQPVQTQLAKICIGLLSLLAACGVTHATLDVFNHTINQTLVLEKLSVLTSDPNHPWYKQPLPIEAYPGFFDFLTGCIDQLGQKECVYNVFNQMVGIETSLKDYNCSCRVKEIGHNCIMGLAGVTGRLRKFEGKAFHIYGLASELFFTNDQLTSCPASKPASTKH